jgi:hypothetical protein
MALQLGALRSALLQAGASEAAADKASEEVASYDNRLASMESSLNVLKWMVGFVLALNVGILFKLLTSH